MTESGEALPQFNGIAHEQSLVANPLVRRLRLTPGRRWQLEVYIDAHLEWRLSNRELAEQVGLSVSHFCRTFSESMQMSPQKYVMSRRLIRAEELIRTTDIGLSQVAQVAGFADQSHLSRYFHRQMGVTPRMFRLSHRKARC